MVEETEGPGGSGDSGRGDYGAHGSGGHGASAPWFHSSESGRSNEGESGWIRNERGWGPADNAPSPQSEAPSHLDQGAVPPREIDETARLDVSTWANDIAAATGALGNDSTTTINPLFPGDTQGNWAAPTTVGDQAATLEAALNNQRTMAAHRGLRTREPPEFTLERIAQEKVDIQREVLKARKGLQECRRQRAAVIEVMRQLSLRVSESNVNKVNARKTVSDQALVLEGLEGRYQKLLASIAEREAVFARLCIQRETLTMKAKLEQDELEQILSQKRQTVGAISTEVKRLQTLQNFRAQLVSTSRHSIAPAMHCRCVISVKGLSCRLGPRAACRVENARLFVCNAQSCWCLSALSRVTGSPIKGTWLAKRNASVSGVAR